MILGIGLGRTGTTSLASALTHLGYNCINSPKQISAVVQKNQRLSRPLLSELVEIYNAFLDYPIWNIYQMLDKSYPGSKFIWTVRDLSSWLVSRKWLIEYRLVRIRQGEKDVPSLTVFNEEDQRKIYLKHYAEVPQYFQSREEDFFCLDLFKGQGWPALCSFLGKPIPTIARGGPGKFDTVFSG